jgi:ABC-type transport system involved in multi-copper enzyme maturation permease subunit
MKGLLRISVLAENTFREAVRDKLLYNLLMFAALMIASSIVLAKLHIGYDERIYRDVGLSAIAFFGVLIAIFVGINLVYREISLKTVYSLLAKPVRRWEFLVGKYLGLVALLTVEIAIMTGFFFFVLWYKGSAITAPMFWAVGLILLELTLVTAIAIFFSSFTTPYLAAMFTVGLWIIGHLLADVRAFGMQDGAESLRPLTEALYWGLPNLDRLDIKGEAAAGKAIDLGRVWLAALYSVLYSTGLLTGAVLLFQRRDFR